MGGDILGRCSLADRDSKELLERVGLAPLVVSGANDGAQVCLEPCPPLCEELGVGTGPEQGELVLWGEGCWWGCASGLDEISVEIVEFGVAAPHAP